MDIQTKDGILLRNIPDGTPEESIKARIASIRQERDTPATNAPPPPEKFGDKIQRIVFGGTGQEPFGEAALSAVKDIPRQAGLTARHAIEGLGDTADFVASPVRAAMNMAGADIQGRSGETAANMLNLPEPQNATERVVGDASRIVAGSGGLVGLAGKAAQATSGVTQSVLKASAARPDVQLASAVGAGTAGGLTREAGGGPLAQAVASLSGGVTTPLAMSGVKSAVNATSNLIRKPDASKVDDVISEALRPQGLVLGDISESVKQSLRKDIQEAMGKGQLTPDVVRRLADYRLTGLTPTAGPLTLDPGIVTRQKNLAALGASSQDPRLQALSQIENANSRKLIENLNIAGAGTADDSLSVGQKVIGTIDERNASEQRKIGSLYDQAKDSKGRSALLDGKAFAKQTQQVLKEELRDEFLPASVKKRIDDIANGTEVLTVDKSEKLKTIIGTLQRNSQDGNTRYALGIVRDALDNTPLVTERGGNAVKAFGDARAANRNWMRTVEETPALKAVRDGVDPDKFVQTYIVGTGSNASVAKVAKLHELIKDVPEAMTAVKNNIAQTLKASALGGKSDEVGKFSGSNYNKALKSIGDAKLKLFFTKNEIDALKALGRVASYEQFQPAGSAVNNSKTAAAIMANVLDSIAGNMIASKLSLGIVPAAGKLLSDPLRNSAASREAGRMVKIPVSNQKATKEPMFLIPAVLAPYMEANQ